jgi:osmotically-inducible protein OsmY
MEDNNRSNRYRDDNRSSSNERQNDLNWDRNYNSNSSGRSNNRGDENVYSSDRERDYWNAKNYQVNNKMGDRYWNRDSYLYSDYDRNRRDEDNYSNNYNSNSNRSNRDYNAYGNNYNSDYNRNYNNDNNRNYYDQNNSYRNDYNRYRNDRYGSNYNDYNQQYKNEGWRDNYGDNDRNWWDKTKDEVASWFGDDDAERRRRMDERRSGQHRGKGPKNYTRSEDRIKEDVSDKLSDDSFLDATNIEVEVKGSEVTLNGKVDSRYSKHRAEDLAEDVTGVTHVQNNLRVNETTPQEPVGNTSSISKTNTGYTSTDINIEKNKKASSLV